MIATQPTGAAEGSAYSLARRTLLAWAAMVGGLCGFALLDMLLILPSVLGEVFSAAGGQDDGSDRIMAGFLLFLFVAIAVIAGLILRECWGVYKSPTSQSLKTLMGVVVFVVWASLQTLVSPQSPLWFSFRNFPAQCAGMLLLAIYCRLVYAWVHKNNLLPKGELTKFPKVIPFGIWAVMLLVFAACGVGAYSRFGQPFYSFPFVSDETGRWIAIALFPIALVLKKPLTGYPVYSATPPLDTKFPATESAAQHPPS